MHQPSNYLNLVAYYLIKYTKSPTSSRQRSRLSPNILSPVSPAKPTNLGELRRLLFFIVVSAHASAKHLLEQNHTRKSRSNSVNHGTESPTTPHISWATTTKFSGFFSRPNVPTFQAHAQDSVFWIKQQLTLIFFWIKLFFLNIYAATF